MSTNDGTVTARERKNTGRTNRSDLSVRAHSLSASKSTGSLSGFGRLPVPMRSPIGNKGYQSPLPEVKSGSPSSRSPLEPVSSRSKSSHPYSSPLSQKMLEAHVKATSSNLRDLGPFKPPSTVRTDFSDANMSDTWEYGDANYEKAKGRRLEDKIADKVAQKKVSAAEVYRIFDKDHNGSLSRPELLMGLNELGFFPNTQEWKHILSKVDINRDGRVTFNEFTQALVMADYDKNLDNKALGGEQNAHRARRDNLGINMFSLVDAWEGVKLQKKNGIFSPEPGNTLGGALGVTLGKSKDPDYFKKHKKPGITCQATVDHLNEEGSYGTKPEDELKFTRTLVLNSSRELVPVRSRKELLAQRSKDKLNDASKVMPDIPNLMHHGAYRTSQFTKAGDLRFPEAGVDLEVLQKQLLDARMLELNKTSQNLINAMKGRGCA
jgi:calcium-binding protein CML